MIVVVPPFCRVFFLSRRCENTSRVTKVSEVSAGPAGDRDCFALILDRHRSSVGSSGVPHK